MFRSQCRQGRIVYQMIIATHALDLLAKVHKMRKQTIKTVDLAVYLYLGYCISYSTLTRFTSSRGEAQHARDADLWHTDIDIGLSRR